ncbi:hypothetical protein N864_03235 [Intrasporangium chromatireducens Q5-1]|uniref:Uncharacterized protein n=1 Tax=Intrasporangium chromatireducens Q5-1 TaxID=584657 RepID=W9GS29_9MICO|nr:hypothetical protein [Intrasporangium chromatireducens]EWT07613.1 hypothetical protein N864_03235 [Intrasporangium chromatireducens Q5-1]
MSTAPGQGGRRRRRDLPDLRPEFERLRRLTRTSATRPAPETEVSGILRRLEIEGGPLVLDGLDGTTYELLFPPGWTVEAEPGSRVTVRGRLEPDTKTTTMAGPVLRVSALARPR